MSLQSIIFKKQYWTPESAEQWLEERDYETDFDGKGVDETVKYYRFRQADPEGTDYITINDKKYKSIKYVVMI